MSSSHHPQSNGITEPANQNILTKLRIFNSVNKSKSEDNLCHATIAVNNHLSESTNYSPKLLMKTMVESDDMTRHNLTNQVNWKIFFQQCKSCK
jgi:hypothetical protein